MVETCNSKGFTWLVRSCWPNQQPEAHNNLIRFKRVTDQTSPENPPLQKPTFSTLPEDLILEILSRISPSSLPSSMLVCRKWKQILDSGDYYDLRRNLNRLRRVLYVVSGATNDSERWVNDSNRGLSVLSLNLDSESPWRTPEINVLRPELYGSVSQAQTAAIGRNVYILGQNPACGGRSLTLRYDPWSGNVTVRAPMMFPRKKFAAGVIAGKIYVAGGAVRKEGFREAVGEVEEFDPVKNRWRVVAEIPRKRYGCVGAAVDRVFYVIGGLKLGARVSNSNPTLQAHVYASTMDAFDVEAKVWLKSRAVPGGGCIVAGCAAGGYVFVLASHAVELSFWRFDGRRRGGGTGEWRREKGPPVPAPLRFDNAVRFSCVGFGNRVFLVQVSGCIDDILRRSGRVGRGLKQGLLLIYDCEREEWSRGPDLPEFFRRGAVCASVEC